MDNYQVLKVDLNPKEKETNEKVYGAIWFDREAGKNDILRADCIICILDNAIPDGENFRCLFALIGDYEFDIKIGALFGFVGSTFAESSDGRGSIEFDDPGPAPGASLGFFSEFGYDENGNLIKL